jgi:hypothetical protein
MNFEQCEAAKHLSWAHRFKGVPTAFVGGRLVRPILPLTAAT